MLFAAQKSARRDRRLDLWQPWAAALLDRLDRNRLPFGRFLSAVFRVEVDDNAIAQYGYDRAHPEFGCLLDNRLNYFSLWNRLNQRGPARRGRGVVRSNYLQLQLVPIVAGDLAEEFIAHSIEHANLLP